jgi:hypothetical protein
MVYNKPQVGDLVQYWIQPTIIKHARRLHGKIGIVLQVIQEKNLEPVFHIDFLEHGTEMIGLDNLIVISRPMEIKADLPAANSHLDKCPK